MISWISCPSPVMLQTSHPFHRSHRSVSNVSRFSLREIGLSWPQCVKDLKKRKLSFHPDLSQIMVLQRGSRMFCKNYTWYGWSMGSCLFFPPWVFFCHRGVFLCLLVFIDFAVLLFSLVRWSLIAVVAVSEVHREVSSWWDSWDETKWSFDCWRVGKHFGNKYIYKLRRCLKPGSCFNFWVTHAPSWETFTEYKPDV